LLIQAKSIVQQVLTQYQSQYYARALKRRTASDLVEAQASTVVGSEVDFNPHQIEAELSPAAIRFRMALS